jgi:hypothetical protein
MKDNYQRLFSSLSALPLPEGANIRIMERIARLEQRVVILRRSLFFLLASFFAAAFVPATTALVGEFSDSSFLSYVSLLASDRDIALSFSQEFFLSLVESLPLMTITLVLSLIFIFLAAMEFINKKTREAVEALSGSFA